MLKKILLAVCVTLITFVGTSVALAEWSPNGPITMMIAFRAGGGADTQSRLIAEELENRRGWKIIPQQVTGKGGVNLLRKIKDQPNDGSVIGIVVTESLGYNLLAAKNAGMTHKDFTNLTTTAGFQMGLVAKTSMGWDTMHDAIAAAKSGERLRLGAMSPRLADLAFVLGEANGIEFDIVMAKGGKGVMNAINAGDVDLGFVAGIQNKGVKAGELVNLASALSTPLTLTPDAPLLSDLGLTQFNSDGYFLFVGPKDMPADARDAIANAIADIVSDSGTKANQMISQAFGGPVVIKGDELDTLITKGVESSEALMKAAQ